LLRRLGDLPADSKAIIFSQFVHVLVIVRLALRRLHIPFCEYYPGAHPSPAARASALTTFNTSENVRVILMDTELAAFGINLTAANYIFFLDQVWEPTVERQAIKRAHRIGQQREVFVEKLVTANTIEETILSLNSDRLLQNSSGSKRESERKAQRKVHSLLNSLKLIEPKENEEEKSRSTENDLVSISHPVVVLDDESSSSSSSSSSPPSSLSLSSSLSSSSSVDIHDNVNNPDIDEVVEEEALPRPASSEKEKEKEKEKKNVNENEKEKEKEKKKKKVLFFE
jgi:hypothetical protein